jgi:hypothetical protein
MSDALRDYLIILASIIITVVVFYFGCNTKEDK